MKRNPWPYAIGLYFVLFISAMTMWIIFAVRNDHQLVRKDYYEQELKYQSELDSFERAAVVNIQIAYQPETRLLTFTFQQEATGTIHFYRPSNVRSDRQVPLALQNGVQTIDVRAFDPGLWQVRLHWSANGAEFRHDRKIVL
ncbi:MAG TPA: FixH family protein [Verrucomicrobiae bacterium]|nr:FixH family protein [Verrucomicrobiae bacterium]